MVRTDVLNRPDGSGQKFAKALTGAWYEMLAQMAERQGAGGDCGGLAGHAGLLQRAAQHDQDVLHAEGGGGITAHPPELKQKMALVRQFCFDHGLLGANTKSVDDVAIKYPDGSVQGKADRVRLVFDASYMQMAAQGKL